MIISATSASLTVTALKWPIQCSHIINSDPNRNERFAWLYVNTIVHTNGDSAQHVHSILETRQNMTLWQNGKYALSVDMFVRQYNISLIPRFYVKFVYIGI